MPDESFRRMSVSPVELSEAHFRVLQKLLASGFEIVSFPLFPTHIGVRKGECAVLLEPQPGEGFGMVGQPSYLVAENLSARVERPDGVYFVWKSIQVEATPQRLTELQEFEALLRSLLEPGR